MQSNYANAKLFELHYIESQYKNYPFQNYIKKNSIFKLHDQVYFTCIMPQAKIQNLFKLI